MPSKKKGDKESKKSQQKKKDRAIEDKTFGLKNKNKSKKVQAHIQAVTKSVQGGGDPKMRKLEEQRKKAKAEAKARKKALQDERDALFGEALLAVKKKTSTKTKAENSAKGRDHDDGEKKGGTSRAMKMMFQMDAKEMEEALTSDPNYVRTIEDEVELQRQRKLAELKAKNIKGTPITEETFKKWQQEKQRKKQEAARKLVEKELKKKKGGKGLSILSGKDLFHYKRDLFKDDEENGGNDEKVAASDVTSTTEATNGAETSADSLEKVAEKVQSDLFLEDDDIDDDDLDDLDDD